MSNLRQLRLQAGLSVSEAARRACIHRQDLQACESGARKMFEGWKARLAPVLGCQPGDLR
jgi:DNA-binding XRE family transcriptional regulator